MEVELNKTKLRVYECGKVERFIYNKWREVENTPTSYGYNVISCKRKKFPRQRVIAMCYLNLDINDKTKVVDHIDRNTINNNVNNLRVVSHQQNMSNRRPANKGYSFYKYSGKYKAKISHNNRVYKLGTYDTAEEAHNAYLEAKRQLHII